MKTITISICLLFFISCGENVSNTDDTVKDITNADTTVIDACNHQERKVLPNAIYLWQQNYSYIQSQFNNGNTNSANTFLFRYLSLAKLYNSTNNCNLMEVIYYMGDHNYGSGELINCPMVAIGSIYKDSMDSVISSDSLITTAMDENGQNILVSRADLASKLQSWKDFYNQHKDVLIWVKAYTYKWETIMNQILQVGSSNPEDLALQLDMVAHSVSPYSIMYSLPAGENGDLVEGYYTYDILARKNVAGSTVSQDQYNFATPCPPYCGKKE